MRFVTMSAALVLSLATLSWSPPASAVPVKKEPAAKTQPKKALVAGLQPKKQVIAKLQPKKQAVAKLQPKIQTVALQTSPQSADATKRTQRKVRHMRQQTNIETQQDTRHEMRQETAVSARVIRIPRLFASSDPVTEARAWIGTNPTDRNSLWCARFMNFVLERSGYQGTGSDAAKSFASYGQRVSGPRVGAIAVMTRGKNGGHVGIVSGIDASGNPIIISGNSNGRRVYEGVYPRGRIYAYVMPK